MVTRQHLGARLFDSRRPSNSSLGLVVGLASTLLVLSCGTGGGDKSPTTPTAAAPVLTTLTVSLSSNALVENQTATASASGKDQYGASIATGALTWSSSLPSVATVNEAGLVTAVSPGTADITATSQGKVGFATISVRAAPPSIVSFTPTHAAYGFTFIIGGSGFATSAVVTINGVAATVVSGTATTLVVAVPSNATSGLVSVTTPNGTTTSIASFTVDAYGPPIQISAGGTYSGNWQSLDPTIAAVNVTTSAPVIIENCHISSAGNGVQSWASATYAANLTVRNCIGNALNPNVAGMKFGFFVVASNFESLVVEHNLINGFNIAGYAVNWPPERIETFSGQTIVFRYNIVHDVEGRFSDGKGGIIPGNFAEKTAWGCAAFSAFSVRNANIEIAWNEIVNRPYVSQSEDNISIPESRGLPDAPINIHDNYVEGTRPANATTYETFGGCGIQVGDSPSKGDVGFVHVHHNQVVGFSGCGLSISSGHHNEFDNNRAISARTLPDGLLMNNRWRIPLQILNFYWDPVGTNIPTADPYWHDNSMHDNVFSAVTREGTLATPRFTQLGPTVTAFNNVDALGHAATTADEVAEYARWKQKVAANAITLGPIPTGMKASAKNLSAKRP